MVYKLNLIWPLVLLLCFVAKNELSFLGAKVPYPGSMLHSWRPKLNGPAAILPHVVLWVEVWRTNTGMELAEYSVSPGKAIWPAMTNLDVVMMSVFERKPLPHKRSLY